MSHIYGYIKMSPRFKRFAFLAIPATVYYVFFFTYRFTILDNSLPSPIDYQVSENCIIVQGQAVTGPGIRVEKGAEFLLSAISTPYPDDLSTNEIEMTGKSVYDDILDYPDYYACNWLVYGKVTGITDIFRMRKRNNTDF